MVPRSKVKLFFLTLVNIMAVALTSFAQMQGGGQQGFGGQSRGQEIMANGELVQIDARSLTIRTPNGETKQYTRTDQTEFIKETPADRSDLVQGTIVFVIGQPAGQTAVTPVMIRITERPEEVPGQHNMADQRMQGGQQGGGQQMGGGRMMGSGSTRDQAGSGPVVGTIIGSNPLTVQRSSGGSVQIEPTADTRIMREISINPADVTVGKQVRIIAPPNPGSDSREAKKVILLSGMEHGMQRPAVNTMTAGDTSRTIGYVGCSLTLAAVDGYQAQGGTKFWSLADTSSAYSGGSVAAWYEEITSSQFQNNRWRTFEQLLAKYRNTKMILWHLCPNESGTAASYSQVVQVFSEIKKKTTARIFVTADGVKDIPCSKDEERCPKRLGVFADRMVRDGLVEKGPAFPSLNSSQIGFDGHPNKDGQKIWGRTLLEFYRDY